MSGWELSILSLDESRVQVQRKLGEMWAQDAGVWCVWAQKAGPAQVDGRRNALTRVSAPRSHHAVLRLH